MNNCIKKINNEDFDLVTFLFEDPKLRLGAKK